MTKDHKPKFIVDAMLGKLARKLRLFGYDSLYSSSIADADIIILAKEQKRILLTKDRVLSGIAQKNNIKTINISDDNVQEQLSQINAEILFSRFSIDGDTARCTSCNGMLSRIDHKKAVGKVPNGVTRNFRKFWECKECKKIYWEGTHIKNLQKFVSELNVKL